MKYKLRGIFSKGDDCLESILESRKIEDIRSFLNPSEACEEDYNNLDNIEDGACLLIKHIQVSSRMYLLIDPDVDGFTSAAIIWQYIKMIDPDAKITFDVQEGKQHGLEHKIDFLVNQAPHYDLIILPDSSSNDIAELNKLNEIGSEVLLIDHHLCDYEGYDAISSNTVLINNQQSQKYKNKSLCGAGMVYKFCKYLDDKLELSFADTLCDLAALGEIADVMSKTSSETNYIIEKGIANINNGCIRELLKLQERSLGKKSFYPYEGLTSLDIAFYVAPLMNAIIRMGTLEENKLLFLGLVQPNKKIDNTSITKAHPEEKETIAEQVARLAASRRGQQSRAKEKSVSYLINKIDNEHLNDNKIIIVSLDENDSAFVSKEITGLIASSLVGYYKKPVLLLYKCPDGFSRGSGRGNDNFEKVNNLKEFLESSGYFDKVAGHANAHGASINSNDIEKFVTYANINIDDDAFDSSSVVDYEFDVTEKEISSIGKVITDYAWCFGNGVDEVVSVIHNIPVKAAIAMGAKKNTTKIIYNDLTFLRFNDDSFIQQCKDNSVETVDIIGKFSMNEWAGRKYLQIIVDDYQFNKQDPHKFDF